VSVVQEFASAVQHAPLIHVWVAEQPGGQVSPQPLAPHVLPSQVGVQHVPPLTHTWPEAHETQALVEESQYSHWLALQGASRQVEPQTLSVAQQWPLKQRPEQHSLSATQEVLAARQTQAPFEQWPEQQSLLFVHASSVGIQLTQVKVLVSQTSPGQQSAVLPQPASPVGIQLTHLPVVLSQFCEQHSVSLEQRPAIAIQQSPLLQVCSDEHVETQAPAVGLHSIHSLESHGADRQVEPQAFAGAQHVALGRPLLRQVWPEAQQTPLQHSPEQQVFTVHAWPAGVQGGTAHFPRGLQYPLQQSVFLLHARPLRWHLGLVPKAVLMPVNPNRPPMDTVTMVRSAWRRDVELANALVSSSKWIGFRVFPSYARDCAKTFPSVKLF
jgi:hypothetical protein